MSTFYRVKANIVEPQNKKVILYVKVTHPDYNTLSDSIGFGLELITDNLEYENTVLGEYIDSNKMCNNKWIIENANRFIKSCRFLDSIIESFDNKLLSGNIEIIFTHKGWMEHIKLNASWDSAAYEYGRSNEYKKCVPEIPNYNKGYEQIDKFNEVSIDYDEMEGFIPIKSSYLKGNMSERPSIVYIPSYPYNQVLSSYISDSFLPSGKSLEKKISVFDMKTVIIKDKYKGPNLFGVCVIQGNIILIQTADEKGVTHEVFPISRIKEIGLAKFNNSDETPIDYNGFLEKAKP